MFSYLLLDQKLEDQTSIMLSNSFNGFLFVWFYQMSICYGVENNRPLNTTLTNITSERNIHIGHDLSQHFARIVATCFLLIIIIATSCNTILIATIITVERLHSFMHVFIVNMAISDLITSLGSIPFDVEYMLRGYFSRGYLACGIMHTTFLISLPSSVLSLLLITAEQFISIVYPCREIITRSRVIASLILTWSYTLVVALFPMLYSKNAVVVTNGNCFLRFPPGYHMFQVVVNFIIPTMFIIGVYIKIFAVSYKQANKTAWLVAKLGTLHDSLTEKELNSTSPSIHLQKKVSQSVFSSLSRNIKAAKRIALLIGVFFICWLSYIIIVAMNYFCQCHPRELTWIANVINYSSAAINPVLYGLMKRTIRLELINRLRRIGKFCMPCLYDINIY